LKLWAEKYNVYIEAQAGFRANMSTVDNIFVLNGLITHILNQGKQLFTLFVDYTKAFDYVVRENLWFKLIQLGLRGNIFNIVKSIYESVKSRVKYCNKLSDEYTCMLGVRQGECLSPFLFSMFVNDLEDIFIHNKADGIDVDMFKIFMLLYADDIVIFANSAEELQRSIDILYDYCFKWKLKVNVSKTKIMIFRKGGTIPGGTIFNYNNDPIEIVSKFCYLGVVFTTGGSLFTAQNTLAGQAQKAIFTLNKYLHKFTYIPPKHKLELFDKLVSPILNYCCEVCCFANNLAIEKVHLQFCKKLLGVKKSTQNDFIYGELGRVSFKTIQMFKAIKYWLRILQAKQNKYIFIVYNLLKTDVELCPNKTNWCTLLKDLLCSLGFVDAWIFQGVGNTEMFLSVVQQRLSDQFIQNWNARLNQSSRALFYNTIASFRFQPYLECFNIHKFCQSFTRLRVSSHRLHIEAGRWTKPTRTPISDRKCITCNKVEDEYHFIIECVMYIDIRKKYIARKYWIRPSMYKFVDLMNSENKNILKNLGIYINKAFIIRNTLLYD
jgi:hypothetical protein